MDALGQKSPGSWAVTGTGIGIDRVASHRLVAGLGWVWVNCRTRESDLMGIDQQSAGAHFWTAHGAVIHHLVSFVGNCEVRSFFRGTVLEDDDVSKLKKIKIFFLNSGQ